jgi:probable F420-dependent oxidoreductase
MDGLITINLTMSQITKRRNENMKIGVTMAFNHLTQPGFVTEAVQAVEAAGFHSIWVPEHVIFIPEYESRYPYSDTGKVPGDPEGVLDPFTALTWIAAATNKIRLGTGICLVPQRQPVYTAKMVADLDYLSGGRVDFGVGIGWLKEEFDNLEMDFATRAKRCLTYIDVMKALWAPGVSSFEGDGYRLEPCHFYPKPVQAPHPPIFFGGESAPALRRVASHGDGWYGFDLSPQGVKEKLADLDVHLDAHGRQRNSIEVFVGSNSQPVNDETLGQYAEAGVDQLIVPMMAGKMSRLSERLDRMTAIVGLK